MESNMRHPIMVLPFALALVCAAPGSAQQSTEGPAQTVTVELSSFKFTPATLTLERGRHYTIRFVNTSSGGHDFSAASFFAASTIAPEDRAKVSGGQVELSGGDTVDVSLVPNKDGTYKIRCTHFMHGILGMKGTIVVR
jgi:plastocyanin